MNQIDVNSLLTQMRTLAAEAQSMEKAGEPAAGTTTGFSEVLQNSVDSVNQAQQKAGELAAAFEAGTTDVDLAEVMISLQKASLSFTAMTEVRNKLVTAYQEIMNMPV